MFSDNDIKIAGDRPSEDIKKNRLALESTTELSDEAIALAKQWGKLVAEKFIKDAEENGPNDEASDLEMIMQRRLLLSFTATVGFEQYGDDGIASGIAQKTFLETVKNYDKELYKSSSDTGAFSFYYLAYRRGSEIDRRMGQTFAMLCSHDGDPVYQELGEALYCWFISVVKRTAKELNIIE